MLNETKNTKEKQNEKPTYRGKIGVSAWVKKDKNGKNYLSVKLDNYFNLFEITKEELK